MKNITKHLHIFLPLLFLIPAFNACVDPVGIDSNIKRDLVAFDTTIIADTTFVRDSIYFIRIDTVISYQDTIVHKVDTVFLPIRDQKYYQIKSYQLIFNEIYYPNGSKSQLQLPWGYYEGTVFIEADTSFTSPILNIKLDVENPYNVLNKQGMSRQEMATSFKLRVNGLIPLGPPLTLNGIAGGNKSAEIGLQSSNTKMRYLRSDANDFYLTMIDWRFDARQEKLIGCRMVFGSKFTSNDTDGSFEMILDINF